MFCNIVMKISELRKDDDNDLSSLSVLEGKNLYVCKIQCVNQALAYFLLKSTYSVNLVPFKNNLISRKCL